MYYPDQHFYHPDLGTVHVITGHSTDDCSLFAKLIYEDGSQSEVFTLSDELNGLSETAIETFINCQVRKVRTQRQIAADTKVTERLAACWADRRAAN